MNPYITSKNVDQIDGPWVPSSPFKNYDPIGGPWIPSSPFQNYDQTRPVPRSLIKTIGWRRWVIISSHFSRKWLNSSEITWFGPYVLNMWLSYVKNSVDSWTPSGVLHFYWKIWSIWTWTINGPSSYRPVLFIRQNLRDLTQNIAFSVNMNSDHFRVHLELDLYMIFSIGQKISPIKSNKCQTNVQVYFIELQ